MAKPNMAMLKLLNIEIIKIIFLRLNLSISIPKNNPLIEDTQNNTAIKIPISKA